MALATRVTEACPSCGDDTEIWLYEKEEPTITKEHYTCEICGCEWTEIRRD